MKRKTGIPFAVILASDITLDYHHQGFLKRRHLLKYGKGNEVVDIPGEMRGLTKTPRGTLRGCLRDDDVLLPKQ